MRKTTESDLVRQCLDLLKLRRLLAWRSNNVPVYDSARKRFRAFVGLKGVSDILAVLPAPHAGKLLAVETKSATGRLSAEQRWFLDTVSGLGGVGVCVRDVGELVSVLDGLGV